MEQNFFDSWESFDYFFDNAKLKNALKIKCFIIFYFLIDLNIKICD